MDNQNGTSDIPALTPAAEHLSTLTTLKEVREKWVRNNTTVAPFGMPTLGGLFGTFATPPKPSSASITKKRTRTRTPAT